MRSDDVPEEEKEVDPFEVLRRADVSPVPDRIADSVQVPTLRGHGD
jgi:hypothetical protein